jgi:hypothetical protein
MNIETKKIIDGLIELFVNSYEGTEKRIIHHIKHATNTMLSNIEDDFFTLSNTCYFIESVLDYFGNNYPIHSQMLHHLVFKILLKYYNNLLINKKYKQIRLLDILKDIVNQSNKDLMLSNSFRLALSEMLSMTEPEVKYSR